MEYQEKQELRQMAGLETSPAKRTYKRVKERVIAIAKVIGFWLGVIACIPQVVFCLLTGRSIK
jgi:hypothetical protein